MRDLARGQQAVVGIAWLLGQREKKQRPPDTSARRPAPSNEELFLNPTYLASLPGRFAYQVQFPKRPVRQARPGFLVFVGEPTGVDHEWPDGVAGDRLRSFVERIERIDEDLKAMNDEKKDVFAEAKAEGFDVKILKEVIRLRKQDQKSAKFRRRQPQMALLST
jgi:uncharacterized protein (UPF0335 family)